MHEKNSDPKTESWQNALAELKLRLSLVPAIHALVTLLAVHTAQLILCFPFLHLTKIMYGYFFGIWPGLVIALVWESGLLLVFTFVFMHCSQSPQSPRFLNNLIAYVKAQRQGRYFHVLLIVLHMSSMPLVTKTALVAFSAVTAGEFAVSGFVSTLVTSINDTCLGGFIAHASDSADQIALYSFLLCFNTILPTTLSVFVIVAISGFAGAESPRADDDGTPRADVDGTPRADVDGTPRADVDGRPDDEDSKDVFLDLEIQDDKDSAVDTPRTEIQSVDTQPGDFQGSHQEATGDLEISTDPGSAHFEGRPQDTVASRDPAPATPTPPRPPPRRERDIVSARAPAQNSSFQRLPWAEDTLKR